MSRFSDKALIHLKDAGWYPGRQIDTTEIEETLSAQGFKIFPAAQQFWQEFDGIGYACPYTDKSGDYIEFDAVWVAEIEFPKFETYMRQVGKPLCPIGQRDCEVFLIDPEGCIYGAEGGTAGLYSYSVDDFVNNFAEGRDASWVWKKGHHLGPKWIVNIWEALCIVVSGLRR